MANLVFAPMNQNKRSKYYAQKLKVRASYKKDWDKEVTGGVEWRGFLYRESDDHEVPIGWCTKGLHYIDWNLRHKHLEECQWRNSKLYGK